MTTLECSRCGRRTPSGNCPTPLDDGHVVQCVGEWAEDEKHAYLRLYIEATRAVRQRFEHTGFVDLFAGPGKVRLRETGEIHDGSPLIALEHSATPFERVVLCDLAPENIAALEARTAIYGDRVTIVCGDANQRIHELLSHLPYGGLNLGLVDPFALRPLRFETLQALARLPRMDLIVNFPTSDLRRNQQHYLASSDNRIARILGDPRWRERLSPRDVALQILDMLLESFESLGYTGARNRVIPVKNSTGGELYRLVFVSKHELGDKIWASITRHAPSGQRGFGFD